MCRPALLTACLMLAGAACSPSQVDPGASVAVSGVLQDQSGSPLAGRPVVLAPQTEISELLGGTLFTALSLGTLCLADPPPEPCASFLEDSDSTDTDDGGTFSFSLRGNDVRTFFGNARSMGVSAALPPAPGTLEGPAVLATFRVQTEQLDLGPIRFWEPRLTTGTGTAGWQAVPGDLGKGSGYRLEFASPSGAPVWQVRSNELQADYDPRVLEDSSGSVSVTAIRDGVAPGTTTKLSYRSAQLGLESGAGAPESRGKPCSVQTGEGSPVALPGCRLTDGRLSEDAGIPGTSAAPAGTPAPAESRRVVVDMGRQVNATLLVIRGCSCRIEGSVDSRTWSPVGEAETFGQIKPSRPLRLRYIRVVGAEPGSISGLREISVWT